MKNNFLKFFTNNIGYKILALLFAFLLWAMVYSTEDPVKTKNLEINVTLTNASYLEDQDKYFEIVGGGRVNITVSAPRSVLSELDETDFTAVANLSNITINSEGTGGTVPVEVTCKEKADTIKVSVNNKTCKIALENLMSKQFVIAANAVGKVTSGHALGDVVVTAPTVLKVSGPESLVKSIATIVATIDVGGMSMNLTDTVVPVLLDAEGNEINTTRLELSNPTVMISAEILKTKSVTVTAEASGTPAAGYLVTGVTLTPETVEIMGNGAVLNGVTNVQIPSELIDVTGAKEDMVFEIDITDYLIQGTELVDMEQANVEVVVSVEEVKSKSYTVSTNTIRVNGLAEGMELAYENANQVVTILGLEKDLDVLSRNNFSLSIDVTDLTEGEHDVLLEITIDDTLYTYQQTTITVVITEIPPETENTEDTEDTEVSEPVGPEEESLIVGP